MSTITRQPSLVLASLNLWRFHEWDIRLPLIVQLLKEVQPDILFTQETQRDVAIDPRSQIEMINTALGYPYCIFLPSDTKSRQKDNGRQLPIEHGLGILSKWPLAVETITLTRAPDDKERRIVALCEVRISGEKYMMANLHFSNSDAWAEDHLKETLRIMDNRHVVPILTGDFNIYDMARYKAIYGERYVSSDEYCQYVSYPNDNASLDYVLLPKRYHFEDFECRAEPLSDHRMIIARIGMHSVVAKHE